MLVKRTLAVYKVVWKSRSLGGSSVDTCSSVGVCCVCNGSLLFDSEKRSMATIETEVTLAFCMISGLSINANIARAMPRWC